MAKEKEFLYVGTYTDTEGNRILKIGTTDNPKRRKTEHNRNYRRAKKYQMEKNSSFEFLWMLPLSKYNILRYEDRNRKAWQDCGIGEFVRNDRFVVSADLEEVEIKIRKTYKISLV